MLSLNLMNLIIPWGKNLIITKKILSEMMLAKIIYKTFIFDLNYLN